jgi:hypothetical protein
MIQLLTSVGTITIDNGEVEGPDLIQEELDGLMAYVPDGATGSEQWPDPDYGIAVWLREQLPDAVDIVLVPDASGLDEMSTNQLMALSMKILGDASSGNFGHAGRPGQRGGSAKREQYRTTNDPAGADEDNG